MVLKTHIFLIAAGNSLGPAIFATHASASTVDPWFDTSSARPTLSIEVTSPTFGEMLNIFSSHFIHSPATGSLPPVTSLLFQVLLLVFGLVFCLSISFANRPYRPLAALLARSRTLWIIARNPLDRWAERWSFRPSRPSSTLASTFITSDTVKPS